MDFQIIYEDEEILVCEKPAGLPVQSARVGVRDMVSGLRNYLAEKQGSKRRGIPYLGLVHRLDQPVQGVMVFAKTKEAAAALSAQAADGRMKKIYQAVTACPPAEDEGTLTDWLLKDGRTNTSRVVLEGTKDAKKAVLSWRVLKRAEGCAWLEIELHSGRHHQIRVQMAHAGMPLLGDRKYGASDAPGAAQLCLCAVSLTFTHPKKKKTMQFSCEPKFQML